MRDKRIPKGYVWRDGYHLTARLAVPGVDVDAEGNSPEPGQLVITRAASCTDATTGVAPMHGQQVFVRKNMLYGVWKKRKVTQAYVKYTSPVYWVNKNGIVRISTRSKKVCL